MQDQYPEIFIQLIASIIIALLLIVFVVTILQVYHRKKSAQEKEMAAMKATYENELLRTRLEIQEDLLKKISLEIHDNIGQVMHLANVNVSILQNMDLPEGAGELMTDTKRILRKVMDDITQLSRSLHSDRITQIGVFAAIKHELTLFAQKKLFEVIISDPYSANGTEFPPETQLLVFRMFQEICNNIIKHAKAQTVSLSIQEKENGIELQVSDDGIGFTLDSPAGKAHNGVGMRSLKSRAVLFKGRIHINSILNKGTIISIFIPAPVS